MGMLLCNKRPVLVLSIGMPRVGNWIADVQVDDAANLTGAAVIEDNGLEWRGTVKRSAVAGARTHARIVGGAGKLSDVIAAKSYAGTVARSIVYDIVSDAGEVLDVTSGGEPLNIVPTYWTRSNASAGAELARVCTAIGAVWRMLPEGKVWVGVDRYPVQKFEHQEIEPDPASGSYVIASERLELRPGVTFDNRRVSRVEHLVNGDSARTVYWAE